MVLSCENIGYLISKLFAVRVAGIWLEEAIFPLSAAVETPVTVVVRETLDVFWVIGVYQGGYVAFHLHNAFRFPLPLALVVHWS